MIWAEGILMVSEARLQKFEGMFSHGIMLIKNLLNTKIKGKMVIK